MGPGNGDDVRFFVFFLGTLCVMFPFVWIATVGNGVLRVFFSFSCFVPDVAAVAWLLHNAGRKVTSGLVMQTFGSFFFLSFTIILGGGFAICRSAP